MKLLFIVVLLVWMATVFFSCQQENGNMNEPGSKENATYITDLIPIGESDKSFDGINHL